MKKLICKIRNFPLLFLVISVLFVSCKKDDDMQEEPDSSDIPESPEVQSVDPDKATASLIFDNMKVVSGSPPESKFSSKGTAISPIDLKIDSDTIFWTPGIVKRIKILKPENTILNFGVRVFVPGASSYIETTLREEEETDEIGILYFKFVSSNWVLPVTFPLTISPLDEEGNIVDRFEIPVKIEKPLEEGYGSGSDCNLDLENTFWEWISYNQENPPFFSAPMYPHIQPGTTFGCCIDGISSPGSVCTNTSDNRPLDYEIIFMRPLIFMTFIDDSEVNIAGQVYSQNLDPSTSDYCSNTPGYSESNSVSGKRGDYIVNTDCSITLENLQDDGGNGNLLDDPTRYIGGGPFIKYTLISDHFMKQTITSSGNPDGGRSLEGFGNMYERREDLSNGSLWYD
ncbi:MAG: hypothetical protein WBM43_04090 [Flavobacteriaceae bacterium]